eukprot:1178499-Heterocapsa_arctica.AAC.1
MAHGHAGRHAVPQGDTQGDTQGDIGDTDDMATQGDTQGDIGEEGSPELEEEREDSESQTHSLPVVVRRPAGVFIMQVDVPWHEADRWRASQALLMRPAAAGPFDGLPQIGPAARP